MCAIFSLLGDVTVSAHEIPPMIFSSGFFSPILLLLSSFLWGIIFLSASPQDSVFDCTF